MVRNKIKSVLFICILLIIFGCHTTNMQASVNSRLENETFSNILVVAVSPHRSVGNLIESNFVSHNQNLKTKFMAGQRFLPINNMEELLSIVQANKIDGILKIEVTENSQTREYQSAMANFYDSNTAYGQALDRRGPIQTFSTHFVGTYNVSLLSMKQGDMIWSSVIQGEAYTAPDVFTFQDFNTMREDMTEDTIRSLVKNKFIVEN